MLRVNRTPGRNGGEVKYSIKQEKSYLTSDADKVGLTQAGVR